MSGRAGRRTAPRVVMGFLLTVGLMLVGAAGAQAAVFTVNTTADNAPSVSECSGATGDCSLRQAIDKSNGTATDDTINVPAGHYTLTIAGAAETNDQTGDLDVNKAAGSVTITGAGARSTTVDATGLGDRVLQIVAGTATLTGFTITGGTPPTSQASPGDGGGIENQGTLTLIDSTVTGNATVAGRQGGGIANPTATAMTLSGDTITQNSSGQFGGGVDIDSGTASITNTTIANNTSASDGGGLDIDTSGIVQFTNDTIAGNTSGGDGGGVWVPGSQVRFLNTIVANNTLVGGGSGGDCHQDSALTDQGNNLDSTGSCFTAGSNGDIVANPVLGPLQNNGGQTDTLALLDGSPAINAGNSSACPATDQRGMSRPQGPACDIGAYEATPPIVATGAASGVTTSSATLNGTVNPDNLATTYHFEYGTTTAYGSSTASQSAGSDYGDHAEAATITGLTPGRTYHFRIVATNAVGTSVGADQMFTAAANAPLVITGPSRKVGSGSATVTGSVNPRGSATTYQFEYGTSIHYGKSTTARSAGSGTSASSVSAHLTGLRPGAIYHYRLVAKNSGRTASGGDRTFRTKALIAVSGLSTIGCTRASSASLRVRVTSFLRTRSTTVSRDGTRIARAGRGSLGVRLVLSSLRRGRHTLTVTTVSAAGTTKRTLQFRTCAPVVPSFTG